MQYLPSGAIKVSINNLLNTLSLRQDLQHQHQPYPHPQPSTSKYLPSLYYLLTFRDSLLVQIEIQL
jgi:hypothetical protein